MSGRLDLNQRPFPPQGNALPGCATSREKNYNPLDPPLPAGTSQANPAERGQTGALALSKKVRGS